MTIPTTARMVWACALLATSAAALSAEPELPGLPRPAQDECVVDLAGMIRPEDAEKIRKLSRRLQRDKGVPIVVVTVKSLADHGGAGMEIDDFARRLFDAWGIGPAHLPGGEASRGMLLLVARANRKARIELGAGWAKDKDADCQRIMDGQIIPRFKQGEFSLGILAGVQALGQLAGGPPVAPPTTRPAAAPTTRNVRPRHPADAFCYIPPDLAAHVKVYHSFASGAARAEINLLNARIAATAAARTPAGLTGQGYGGPGGSKARGLQLTRLAVPLNRPLTVSLWWRLDAPMKVDSAFDLIALHTDTGYVSNFVRGKGTWCALTGPTYVVQVYRFPGISNVNGIGFGPGWADHGVWHHAALTVSAGSRVSVYWDGKLRSRTLVKGRLFTARDVIRTISLGSASPSLPMTVDEVLVLDRALSDDEIADYVTAVRKLAEMGFPLTQAAPSTATGAGGLRRD